MNALPTTGCDCATCVYLRATVAPAVTPFPSAPVTSPWPPPYQAGWRCGCGAWVGNMQVHTCPFQGVFYGAASS